jgi:TetR/AcrR family transcriptional regulator
LFRHFENKEALLNAVIEWVAEDIAVMLNDFPKQWTENLERDLTTFARAYFAAIQKHDGIIRLLIGESGRRDGEIKSMVRHSNRSFMENLATYLEQAKLMGQIRADLHAVKTAGVLIGMVTIAALRSDKTHAGESLDEYIDIFIRGIRKS